MVKHLPNFLTILNLAAGCFSILFALNGQLHYASWMIGLAAVFDFMDGFSARLLKAYSELGKVLDSLADVVSFGVAPGFIMLILMKNSGIEPAFLAYFAFLVPALSALRLAKFSIDERQKESFLGLATPANAIFFASFPLIIKQFEGGGPIHSFFTNPYILFILTILFSILLISNIPLIAMKFRTSSWKENSEKYIFIILSVLLLILLKYLGIPFIILTYFLISVITFRRSADKLKFSDH